MLSSIDHVQLGMPRGGEDEARAFYVQLLGMRELAKPEPLRPRGGAWFRSGPVHVHLGVEEPFAPAKKAHVAFLTADLEGLAKRLRDAGCDVAWDETLPERRRFYCADAFGNRLEFLAQGDGFSQRS